MASPLDVGAASGLENRSIQILAIESDPVIQSGLVTCLNRFPDLQVSEAADDVGAWQILTERVGEPIDLILLGLQSDRQLEDGANLVFCRAVKARYPNLPILLLAAPRSPDLTIAFQLGIEGCCLRGASILDLVASIRQVAAGQTSWTPEILQQVIIGTETRPPNWFNGVGNRLRLSSLQQIETTLTELNTNLDGDLSVIDRLLLTGRKRELNTARWLVKRLLPTSTERLK